MSATSNTEDGVRIVGEKKMATVCVDGQKVPIRRTRLRTPDQQSFAAFSAAVGKRYVSAETAIKQGGSALSLCQRARRLGQVIRFARYIRAEDPHHDLPPTVYGSETRPRPVPYIFSTDGNPAHPPSRI